MGKIIKKKKDYNAFKLKTKKTTVLDFLRKREIPWGEIIQIPKKNKITFLTKQQPIIIPQYEISKRRRYKRRKIKG